MRGPGVCPQVEGLAGPLLVPVGWESRLALRVRNLQHFRVSRPVGREWGQSGRWLTTSRVLTVSTTPGSACLLPLLAGAARRTPEAASIPGRDGWGCRPRLLPGPAGEQPSAALPAIGCLLQPSPLVPSLQRLTIYIPVSRGLLGAAGTPCAQPLPQACCLVGDVALNNGTHSGRSVPEKARGSGILSWARHDPPSTHSSTPPWPSGSSWCPSTSPGVRVSGWTMPVLFMVSLGAAGQAEQGVGQKGEAPQCAA